MQTLRRTVLVSGASSGIGKAVVKQLLTAGHRVIGLSRNTQQLDVSLTDFSAIELDLAKLSEIPLKTKQLLEQYSDLDAVVFAAGYGRFGHLEQFSFEQIENLMTVNFTAQVFLTRALLPALKLKPHSNLIYIGSEAALKGSRKGTIYCASKFALRGFTQALRDECGNSSVRVSLINPGMVDTAFYESLSFKPGTRPSEALQAADVADAVTFILKASASSGVDEINLNPLNKVIAFKK